MDPTPFHKLSGAGNDFVALVSEDGTLPHGAQIRGWCTRRLSLGADGLFVIERQAEHAPTVVRMHYFNADGGRADLCGNGTRCAARLARELGWFDPGAEELLLETDVGPLAVHLDPERPDWVEVATPAPPEAPRWFDLGEEPLFAGLRATYVEIGVPHLVVAVAAPIDELDMRALGPLLRSHPGLGAAGANANFACETRGDEVALRTWERGVEGETLACGSGAVATALSCELLFDRPLPISLRVRSGDLLQVRRDATGTVLQSGPARLVASGELF